MAVKNLSPGIERSRAKEFQKNGSFRTPPAINAGITKKLLLTPDEFSASESRF